MIKGTSSRISNHKNIWFVCVAANGRIGAERSVLIFQLINQNKK
jgi:hypothetical protein